MANLRFLVILRYHKFMILTFQTIPYSHKNAQCGQYKCRHTYSYIYYTCMLYLYTIHVLPFEGCMHQSSDFLLFSCVVYFVCFTNYFCVCIFVYLLTINFVRVLIVYFQNIVYSCMIKYLLMNVD